MKGGKKAFKSDPVNRKASGVRRYKISRKVDEPNYIIVDLEFDDLDAANSCLAQLQNLWSRVEGSVMNNPRSRIIQVEIENL